MKGTVGVVGLGIMGGAMARNLAEAGWQVLGIDTDSAKCAELARAGVAIQPDVASLAHAAPMILLSLPSPAAARSVAVAIAASGAPPRTVAEVSTLALADKLAVERVLREAGHAPLDCPISGTGAQAAVKDLVIYASGDSAAIEAIAALTGVEPAIKWPNDLVANGRKLGGLLIETEISGPRLAFAVIGLGINVRHAEGDFSPELHERATSLYLATGQLHRRADLLVALPPAAS